MLSPSRQAAKDTESWRTALVACSLTSNGLGERTTQWHQSLDGAVRQDIPDGLRLTLPATRAGDVAPLAAAEQQCCPFFDFRLHLEVRAGADLLTALFGPTA